MITEDMIAEIGRFGQPHGIKGELNASLDVAPDSISCLICDVNGIFVPFFISSFRSRGPHSQLLTIDGINNEVEAALLKNHIIYGLKEEVHTEDDETDSDAGFYAEDLIGYTIADTEGALTGKITDVDDSTDNVLFLAETPQGEVLIPVTDEFITDIDTDNKIITFDLPDGILNLK